MGLPARSGLGRDGTLSPTRSLMLGLLAGYLGMVGSGDLVPLEHSPVLPGDGAVHLDPELSGSSGFNIVIAVTVASAPAIMRIVRGLALDTKSRDYILAAQTRGEHPLRIMVYELLPNAAGRSSSMPAQLGYTTVAITTLTFLGLGLQPPDPDWAS